MAALAACGSKAEKASTNSGQTADANGSKYSLVTFTDTASSVQAGSPQRVTFGLGDSEGALVEAGPARLPFEVLLGSKVIARLQAPLHRAGLSRGYYPIVFTPPEPGFYTARTHVSGAPVEASFQAARTITIPRPGRPMPVVDTPTVANRRGVNPICTRSPACPLHDINLRDAMATGKPIALLVATPAYCQTAICGPVLDVLLSQRSTFREIQMIHAEVYADGRVAAADIAKATLAPLPKAYRLPFEPALFLIGPDRVLARRLDTIFDQAELRNALRSVVA